jgi:hypothetical protein
VGSILLTDPISSVPMDSTSSSTTMESTMTSSVGSCSKLDLASNLHPTSKPTIVYSSDCDAHHITSLDDSVRSHNNCLATCDNGDSQSAHPTYFKCGVINNPNTLDAAAAWVLAKVSLKENIKSKEATRSGPVPPPLAWNGAREAFRGGKPFIGAETKDEPTAYHCHLTERHRKMETEKNKLHRIKEDGRRNKSTRWTQESCSGIKHTMSGIVFISIIKIYYQGKMRTNDHLSYIVLIKRDLLT